MTSDSPRIHALDALRAIALLLGIVLHATLSFIPGMDETIWPIRDDVQSVGAAIIDFVIHVFRMSLFFMVAGLLARLLLQRRGLKEFIRNRLMRIALPLLVFWPLCMTGLLLAVGWYILRRNNGVMPPIPAEMQEAAFSWLHLWFLWVLLWIYTLVLLLRALVLKLDPMERLRGSIDRLFHRIVDSPLASLVLAPPVMFGLAMTAGWVRYEGIRTPGYGFVPYWPSLLIYMYVFLLGWMLDRQRSLLDVLQRRAVWNLSVGVATTLASMALGITQLPIALCAACYALALTSSTLGWLGLGMRWFSGESRTLRYLSDASYWMYIAHLPLVMAAQTAVMSLPLHWTLKLGVVNVLTFAVLLVSYRYMVRSTWIGQLLNGRRQPGALPNRILSPRPQSNAEI